MSGRLLHYTNGELAAVRSVGQDVALARGAFKPLGLWVSVEGEDDWARWCAENPYAIGRHCYEIELVDAARILRLDSVAAMNDFHDRYWRPRYPEHADLSMLGEPDWVAVARDYGGIVIAPYHHTLRFPTKFLWYYGWDCASGCLWDADVVKSVRELS